MKISVVIPTYQEASCIERVIAEIPKHVVDEIVIIDKSSPDGTADLARRAGAAVYTQEGKGYGNAIMQGVRAATGDIVVIMDADGSHDPADIPRLVEKAKEGYEYVSASRYFYGSKPTDDDTWIRFAGNMLFTWLTNILHGTKVTDSLFTFIAASKKALLDLNLTSPGFEFCTEIIVKARKKGLKFIEIPTHEKQRYGGDTKVNAFWHGLKILRMILRRYS